MKPAKLKPRLAWSVVNEHGTIPSYDDYNLCIFNHEEDASVEAEYQNGVLKYHIERVEIRPVKGKGKR